jgi:putative lysine transport system substrate-binding protein
MASLFYEVQRRNEMNTRKILAIVLILAMALSLSACAKKAVPSGVEDGVLTVAMECAYAPYNWAQTDSSNGAVPIKGSNLYANGYDVMTAQQICDANGWKLEVVQLEWDSLIPAILSGTVDCTIAGQSMTAERMETVDFAGPYLYATMVCLTRKDSAYANAKGLKDLSGGTCTSQSGTIWYDTCLPQIGGAKIQSPAADAPAMLMAVASGTVDFVCTDMPTAQGALIAYPDLKILDFAGSGDDFEVSEEEINIGIALKKGNKTLKDAIDKALKGKTADDFNALMADAIKVQPIGQ